MHPEIDEVLEFWFGGLDVEGLAAPEKRARWFEKSPAFDDEARARFGALHASLASGEREAWRQTPKGLLAYVIVLDQLSRNMFRDTAEMFASDAQALEAARDGVDAGLDRALVGHGRVFLYMPFMHSEALDDQARCVALFRAFQEEAGTCALGEALSVNLDFALQHERIVARFGRYPHRNALLGRASTAEEEAFLNEPGSSF